MTDTPVGVYRHRYTPAGAPNTVTGVALAGDRDPNPDTVGFKVAWDPGTVPSGSLPVTGYKVFVDGRHVASPYTNSTLVLSSSDLPLLPGQSYSVEVTARNIYGESAAKSTALPVVIPDGGRPPAPVVAVAGTTDTTISLSWSVVAFSPAAFYRVFATSDLSTPVATTAAGATGATLTGLTVNTTHMYVVRAVDPLDTTNESVDSNTVTARTGTAGGVTPKAADDVVEGYGWNWHANFDGTYGNDQTPAYAAAALDNAIDCGVRYIRDRMPVTNSTHIKNLHLYFKDSGGKYLLHCGADRAAGTSQGAANTHMDNHFDLIQGFGADYVAGILAFEGVNEPNNDGDSDWFTKTFYMTKALHDRAVAHSSSPSLAAIPRMGPGLANRLQSGHPFPQTFAVDFAALGDLSSYVDIGNLHVYPAGGPAGARIIDVRDLSKAAYPAPMPFQVTEGGYFDFIKGYTGGSQPVPDDVQAVYHPRELMEKLASGAGRFYVYEGMDDVVSTGSTQTQRLQASFGMVRTPAMDQGTHVRKPQWHAMHRFLALMADGTTPTLLPLRIAVTGGGSNFKWDLRQKADGTYYLVMWRDERLYTQHYKDGKFIGGTYEAVTPVNATVTLQSALPVALHKPSSQGTKPASVAYKTLPATTSFNVAMDGELQVAVLG